MKNKKYIMIYVVEENLHNKIIEMKKKNHINISSLIRDFLENKYKELDEEKT